VLQRLDADASGELAGEWPARRTPPGPEAQRVIAVDRKTLRGSGHGSDDSRHLFAATGHAHSVVLGQVEADTRTTKSPCSPRCLTGWTATARSSPPALCTPSAPTPNTWPGALGWAADQITVIDTGQGHSGASAADREGFQHLVAEVSLGRPGS
jgi:hypothetical protein